MSQSTFQVTTFLGYILSKTSCTVIPHVFHQDRPLIPIQQLVFGMRFARKCPELSGNENFLSHSPLDHCWYQLQVMPTDSSGKVK